MSRTIKVTRAGGHRLLLSDILSGAPSKPKRAKAKSKKRAPARKARRHR